MYIHTYTHTYVCVLHFSQLISYNGNVSLNCQVTWEDLSKNFISAFPLFFFLFLHFNQKFQQERLYMAKVVLHSRNWRKKGALKAINDWIIRGPIYWKGANLSCSFTEARMFWWSRNKWQTKNLKRVSPNTCSLMTSSVLYRVSTLNRWNTVRSSKEVCFFLFYFFLKNRLLQIPHFQCIPKRAPLCVCLRRWRACFVRARQNASHAQFSSSRDVLSSIRLIPEVSDVFWEEYTII